VPAKNGHALAQAIRRLIYDAGLRRTMGLAGRELAVAEFSVERFVELSLAAYRDLLPADVPAGRPA
jgi:glycosyltransferase involved in cell wall biosynthesis